MKASMIPPLPSNQQAHPERPLEEVRGNQTHLKARLAYLRLQTIGQYFGKGPGESGRQWKNIDQHLHLLHDKGRNYCTA
jgi:hypothetical protein